MKTELKFKVGDRVVYIRQKEGTTIKYGQTGVIVEIRYNNNCPYRVDFSESGNEKDWGCYPDSLRLPFDNDVRNLTEGD